MREALRRGALAAALLTVPLVAVWFVAWRLLDLPFPPFDLFDWIARVLPGRLVTLVIDGMVAAFTALHINAVNEAKLVEQAMAVMLILVIGIGCGAGMFASLDRSGEPGALMGGILGAMLGGFTVVLEDELNRLATPGATVSGVWLFSTLLVWGLLLGGLYERVRHSDVSAGRRQFLVQVGNVAAVTTMAGVAIGTLASGSEDDLADARWSSTNPLPNAGSAIVPVAGTRRELTPIDAHYRIDVDTRPPAINRQRWRLRINGLIGGPISLSMIELRRMEPTELFATLSCISNPPGGDLISTTRWTGVSLARLMRRFRVPLSATHVKVSSADGFFEVVPVADIMADERIMLAYAWDGVPIPIEHGRPLRLYIPDRYGMKQPKWILALDLIDHWEAGYWVARGWDRDGRVKSAAAIDVVTANLSKSTGGTRSILVGGIAYAGARGVSRVEVRIDDGEWRAAELRPPLSDTSWTVWRAELPMTARDGEHEAIARCFEADGTPQNGRSHVKRFTL